MGRALLGAQAFESGAVGGQVGVLDGLVDRHHLLEERDGCGDLAVGLSHSRDVREGDGLSGAIADVAPDGQGLLEIFERALRVSKVGIDLAEVVKRGRLSDAVAHLALDG